MCRESRSLPPPGQLVSLRVELVAPGQAELTTIADHKRHRTRLDPRGHGRSRLPSSRTVPDS